ncbi:MAG: hypothetical protein AAGI11_05570 [Pseudomonadota bacterium]
MHELTRLKYLNAMGIPAYVSRRALPGAAKTRRLVQVPRMLEPAGCDDSNAQETPLERSSESIFEGPAASPVESLPARQLEQLVGSPRANSADKSQRFSIAALVTGGYLWLEDLADRPLAKAQVELVQSMAFALGGKAASADITQFDWPIHSNSQLDLGSDAGSEALMTFLLRRLDQSGCRGVILLGQPMRERLGDTDWHVEQFFCPHSTAEMLASAGCKRAVWQVLSTLREA